MKDREVGQLGAVGVVGPCAKNGVACDYNEIFSWLFQSSFFSSILMDSQPFVEKSKSCEFLMLFQIELSTPQPSVHSEFVATFVSFLQKVCPFGIFWELHSLCLASLADKPLLIFMEGKSVVAYPLQTEASHALSIFPES